jgi:hypothetical protein
MEVFEERIVEDSPSNPKATLNASGRGFSLLYGRIHKQKGVAGRTLTEPFFRHNAQVCKTNQSNNARKGKYVVTRGLEV